MEAPGFYEDLEYVIAHIYVCPKEGVRRWTQIECNDYQVPLSLILGFLVFPHLRPELSIRSRPEYHAVVDIVQNSGLSELLEHDNSRNCIRYRSEVPASIREKVAQFVRDRSVAIE